MYIHKIPTEIEKSNSMIFHDQQCNFHVYFMHGLQPPLIIAASSLSINVEFSNSNVFK